MDALPQTTVPLRFHIPSKAWHLVGILATSGLIVVWPMAASQVGYVVAACALAGIIGLTIGHIVGHIDDYWQLRRRYWLGWIGAAIGIAAVWFALQPLDVTEVVEDYTLIGRPWSMVVGVVAITLAVGLMAVWLEIAALLGGIPWYSAFDRKRRTRELQRLRERVQQAAPDHVFPSQSAPLRAWAIPGTRDLEICLATVWSLVAGGVAVAGILAAPMLSPEQFADYDGMQFQGQHGDYDLLAIFEPSLTNIHFTIDDHGPIPIESVDRKMVAGKCNRVNSSHYIAHGVDFYFGASGPSEGKLVHVTLGGEPRPDLEKHKFSFYFSNGEDGELLELPLRYDRARQVFGQPLMVYRH